MYNQTVRYATPETVPVHPDWMSVNKMHVTLRRAYLDTTDEQRAAGIDWYPNALSFAQETAEAYGLWTANVVGVIAALSPRTAWARNQAMTIDLIETGTAKGLGWSIGNARKALVAEDPIAFIKGRKTNSFARNIMGDYSVVTVDRWAARSADPKLQVTRHGINDAQYDQIARAYEQAAVAHGLTGAELQAILWVAARGKAE